MPHATIRRRPLGRLCAGVLAGVLAACVVGGCGPQRGEAGPFPSPSPVAATTAPAADPTPSPTPSSIYAAPADAYVKPTRPAILDGKPSEDAAIAFARYYLRMYTYAYLTGDAAGLNALARAGCVFCKNVKDDIAATYGVGHHTEGGAIGVDTARAHDYEVEGGFGVWMTVRQSPRREVDAAGRAVSEHPTQTKSELTFVVYWTKDEGWKLGDLAVEES